VETQIKEKIRVVCLFENGRIRPLVFFWRNRNYKILRTAFAYSKNLGREKIFYFSVESNNETLEISFNREKFSWTLEKIF